MRSRSSSCRVWAVSLLLLVFAACAVTPAAPESPASEPEVVPSTKGEGAVADEPPPADEQPPVDEPSADPEQPAAGSLAAGEACSSAQECASGICEGEGCEVGVCAPASRACTKDLRPYCGCDGQTFRTSGSCPGQLYAYRGECKASE